MNNHAIPINFLLNDNEINLPEVGPGDTLLDFLRLSQRLTGTKEGCAEGDCGACTVLAGHLDNGSLHYEPVNACIRFLPSCHRCHIVTIEYLCGQSGVLHPVQQAMIGCHGSQCGFCTPGFIMALYGLLMKNPDPSTVEIEAALQGNLCRCTGYEPIVKAARIATKSYRQAMDSLAIERTAIAAKLASISAGASVEKDGYRAVVPVDCDALAAELFERPDTTIIAGATDVGLWVTKRLQPIVSAVFISHLMKFIDRSDAGIRIGAGVTYSEALPAIAEFLPGVSEYIHRIGSWQIRNAGTIGGNIANGSPIGDMPPLLIALDAKMTLRCGDVRRELPLEKFFIEYGKQDRKKGEFLESVFIPCHRAARVAGYKVSKRRDADISALAAGIMISEENGMITEARIAFGGMAGIPKRAVLAEAALRGHPFTQETFDAASFAIADDFQPLSDWRASAEYRGKVAANLLRRFWLEQQGEPVRLSRTVEE